MRIIAFCLSLCLAAAPAAARDITRSMGEGQAAALLHLPGPAHLRPAVVLMLADGRAPDLRADRHIEHLLGAGIAVLEPQAPVPDIRAIFAALARRTDVDGSRVGLLTRGRGAHVDLRGSPIIASVLLYPGCTVPPPQPAPGAVLLMHGDADDANPTDACLELAEAWRHNGLEVRQHIVPGASYGWDLRPIGPSSTELLPRPDGRGRVRAQAWPDGAEYAAGLAARFLAAELDRGS